jgi:hypothetical protein
LRLSDHIDAPTDVGHLETLVPIAGPNRTIPSLRWLARRVLPEGANALELSAPTRVRDQLEGSPQVVDYVVRWARDPEPGGAFDLATQQLRELPDALLVRTLIDRRYDGLVYTTGGSVIGHVFDQQHGETLHAFSLGLSASFQLQGYAHVLLLDYLAYASRRSDIAGVRIGRGQNGVSRRFLSRLSSHGERLAWRVEADGWVKFSR